MEAKRIPDPHDQEEGQKNQLSGVAKRMFAISFFHKIIPI